jgi:hypothetical protein
MALHENGKRNGNNRAISVQCVPATPLPLHGNGKEFTTTSS